MPTDGSGAPDRRPTLVVLAARSVRPADGIRDYTARLVQHLRARGDADVALELRDPSRSPSVVGDRRSGVPPRLAGADVVLVQYNPFSFGRRGFAPGLPALLWRLRRRRRRPLIAMMVHETYVDMRSLRWALMGAWQRAQLLALQGACDVQFCSIERWTDRLRRTWPGKPVHHLPVASTLPNQSADRASARASLGVGADVSVIACFGLRHPGRLRGHVLASARAIAETGRRPVVLNLGTDEHGSESVVGLDIRSPGFLDDRSLATLLSAADVFLTPYADGVSTRRTTMMAALQHGIPVVGTDGHLTDGVLRRAPSALRLVPVADVAGFAAAVVELTTDPRAREELGRAGRILYETSFDWPVLTGRLLAALDASSSQGGGRP